jgi:hypothetical protein
MNDEVEMFMDQGGGMSFIESLTRARLNLKDSTLMAKLEEVIAAEIELALMGAAKAKSEILKNSKDTVRPIK